VHYTHDYAHVTPHEKNDDSDADDDSDDLVESVDDLDALFSMLAAQRRGEMLFAEEMRKPDAEVDFVRAAAFVAMHRRPELSRVEDAVEELDELAAELQKLLPPERRGPLPAAHAQNNLAVHVRGPRVPRRRRDVLRSAQLLFG
jgi:hypothetical protein